MRASRWLLCLAAAALGAAQAVVGCGALLGIEEGTLDPSLEGGAGPGASGGAGGNGAAMQGGSGVGGTAGMGGSAGSGGAPGDCMVPSDCGDDTECDSWSCEGNRCVQMFEVQGTVVAEQTDGDCKQNVCDGRGAIVVENDDADLPVDGNECTDDVCTGGVPSNPNEPVDTPCGVNQALKCDANGDCKGCATAADCGPNPQCKTYTCDQSSVCVLDDVMNGISCGVCKVCQAGSCQNVNGGTDPNQDCDLGNGAEVCNSAGACQCNDGLLNYGEPNKDCGGPCPKCANGQPCNNPSTCQSNNCTDGVCCNQACGGLCEACNASGTCLAVVANTDPASECDGSDTCNGGKKCFCADGAQNNGETGQDCGGPHCTACQGQCMNSMQDPNESDVDCGGVCPPCGTGSMCQFDSDCISMSCFMGYCCQPDPPNVTCSGVCGFVTNNCGQTVDCTCPMNTFCNAGTCDSCDKPCDFWTCGFTVDNCNNALVCPCCGPGAPCDSNPDCCGNMLCIGNMCVMGGSASSSSSSSGVGGAGGAGGVGGAGPSSSSTGPSQDGGIDGG